MRVAWPLVDHWEQMEMKGLREVALSTESGLLLVRQTFFLWVNLFTTRRSDREGGREQALD